MLILGLIQKLRNAKNLNSASKYANVQKFYAVLFLNHSLVNFISAQRRNLQVHHKHLMKENNKHSQCSIFRNCSLQWKLPLGTCSLHCENYCCLQLGSSTKPYVTALPDHFSAHMNNLPSRSFSTASPWRSVWITLSLSSFNYRF